MAKQKLFAADHIEMGDQIGRIAPGYLADLIAADDDPLKDITELKSIDFVMKGGEVFLNE